MRTTRRGPGRGPRPPFDVPSERGARRDVVTAVAIALVLVLVAGLVMLSGSAARSEFRTADTEQPTYSPSELEPTSLAELWSHPSEGRGAPLVTKGNLVTVEAGGALIGRDAGSGVEQWSYIHAGRLCAAVFYAESLVSAYDGASGCSDVTALNPETQQYSSTRQSAFADTMELRSTWSHALALSRERVEIWRNDLVRTVEYGAVAAPQESGMQPREGCTIGSADLTDQRFAVSERCPGDQSERLTLSKTVPEDNRKPEEIDSGETGADGLWIIDVGATGVLALQSRGATWTVEWFTSPTEHRTVLRLEDEPTQMPSTVTVAADNIQARWFDGDATHAFTVASGVHSWTADGTTGPGLTGGVTAGPEGRPGYDWVLLPTLAGFSVRAFGDGAEKRRLTIPLDQGEGVTGLAQVGDVLYARRADGIQAYKITSD